MNSVRSHQHDAEIVLPGRIAVLAVQFQQMRSAVGGGVTIFGTNDVWHGRVKAAHAKVLFECRKWQFKI